ncbi:MAG TPA: fused MFS/spermidine synthase [Candidatus Polarisedimenticolia bacterium]|nr:fused MFS/spermidine synthase [Candidatus Polarisedimenticolia bacterium]
MAVQAGRPLAALSLGVGCFMAGLAAGAALWGARGRRGRPLRLFALLHAAAALPGLAALHPGAGGALRSLLRASSLPPDGTGFLLLAALLGGGAAFATALLLGGALPLLMPRGAGGRHARTYGLLAGALCAGSASGALGTGFVLLPLLGHSGGMAACAALSLAAAAAAAWLARGETGEPAPRLSGVAAPCFAAPGAFPAAAALMIAGLCLTALEVVWARIGSLTLGSSTLAGSLVLAAVIAGLGIGSTLGPLLPAGPAAILSAAALAVAASDPLLGRLPLAAAWPGWEWVPPSLRGFALLFAAAALPAAMLGAVFPSAFARIAREGRPEDSAPAAGFVSALSSAGACAGAPLGFAALAAGWGSRATLLGASAALALASFLAGFRRGSWATPALALAVIAALAATGGWDAGHLSSAPYLHGPGAALSGESVLFAREGPDALVTVRRSATGALSLQVNGKTDASTGGDMTTQVLMAQLPLLLRAAAGPEHGPARTFIVGLGSGVTTASALTHPGTVETQEISPEVIEAARLFPPALSGILSDPRLRLAEGDARAAILFRDSRHDVILSQPSNPWIAGQAVFFTREFFEAVSRRLQPGGFFCQWVQGYGLDAPDFLSIVGTFRSVFPNATLWEESTAGGDYLLIASTRPMAIDPDALRAAMAEPAVRADLAAIGVAAPEDLLSRYVAGPLELSGLTAGAPLQSDDRLSLEFTAPRALHRETLGSIVAALEPWRASPARWARGDRPLEAALASRMRAARQERRWADGLGLLRGRPARDPWLMAGLSYLKAGMRHRALSAMQQAASRMEHDPLPRLVLAHIHMAAGDSGRAARELEVAVDRAPADARSWLFLARARFASGRLGDALRAAAEARRLAPELAEASSDRCALLLAAGDEAGAGEACDEALRLDPDGAEAWANRGLVHSRLGAPEQARACYRRALEIDPALADARYNWASLEARQDRPADGLAVLAPALVPGEETDAGLLRLAARLSLQAADAAAARRYLKRSFELEPVSEEGEELLALLPQEGEEAGSTPTPRSREEE